MKKKTFFIKGMHCISCETIIESELMQIEGMRKATVDHKKSLVEIEYEIEPDLEAVAKKIKPYGYEIDPRAAASTDESSAVKNWFYSLLVVIGLAGIYYFFSRLGFIDAIDIQDQDITTGAAFLVGVAASLSTCLVIVGAVVISFGSHYHGTGTGFFQKTVRPNLLFHAGRLLTFYWLGGVLGTIGGQLSLGGRVVFILTLFISLVLLWLGLNTLGLLPSVTRLGIHLPKNLTGGYWSRLKKSNSWVAPAILGGLSFFLPCGFTQSMQLYALSSGSFQKGSIALFAFALGTAPVLLALGTGAAWIRTKQSIVLQRAIGIVIVFFALYTFQTGWAIKDVRSSLGKPSGKVEDVPAITGDNPSNQADRTTGEKQVVNMSITSRGFEPKIIYLKKDVPVQWIINGEKASGCTNEVVVPSLNISQKIRKGINIVEFTPTKEGKIPFSCWMGMVRGEFIVK